MAFKPSIMMTQTQFNFMTYNKMTNKAYKVPVAVRTFATSEDHSLMDNLDDVSEFETKVVQSDKLVRF